MEAEGVDVYVQNFLYRTYADGQKETYEILEDGAEKTLLLEMPNGCIYYYCGEPPRERVFKSTTTDGRTFFYNEDEIVTHVVYDSGRIEYLRSA